MKSIIAILSFLVLSILIAVLATPASQVKHGVEPPQPRVFVDVRDGSLERFAPMWQKEVERRFDHAVVALCHGGDILHGEWIVENYGGQKFLTVEQLIDEEHKEYPGRTIVLLCCNPHHDILHGHPDVYYSMSSVWCVPDRADDGSGTDRLKLLGSRWDSDTNVTGNIFEFANGE